MFLSSLLFTLLAVGEIQGRPDGAPLEACGSMTPNHTAHPREGPGPCRVTVSKKNCKGGDFIRVVIEAIQSFKGFLVMMKNEAGETIGTWSGDKHCKGIKCGNGLKMNAMTHISNNWKNKVIMTWSAPQQMNSVGYLHITCVVKYEEYYIYRLPESFEISH